MYKIEKKEYGYKLTFADGINEIEMQKWVDESAELLKSAPPSFGVLVDMRTLIPLSHEAQKIMGTGQKLYKVAGMQRSSVILTGPMIKMQFIKIARSTGIYDWERYFDASATHNWETAGEKWITDKQDPDRSHS